MQARGVTETPKMRNSQNKTTNKKIYYWSKWKRRNYSRYKRFQSLRNLGLSRVWVWVWDLARLWVWVWRGNSRKKRSIWRRKRVRGMKKCVTSLYSVCLIILASLFQVESKYSALHIKDDSRSAYLVEPFCFAPGGSVSLEVRSNYPTKFFFHGLLSLEMFFLPLLCVWNIHLLNKLTRSGERLRAEEWRQSRTCKW